MCAETRKGAFSMSFLKKHKYLSVLLMLLLTAGMLFTGCGADDSGTSTVVTGDEAYIVEEGHYTAPQDVADYLYEFGHLPDNFITKKEARDLGWDSQDGNLDDVAPGMSIGGDTFGNREGILPKEKGRKYYECDVNYEGGYRGGERIVYSNDGLIFYTEDHYKSFEQLY
ncbi:MAG: ribonuclease [Peptococcaceae bacterium]|nr:ribonuclease [Peptococcaceae bacterium]